MNQRRATHLHNIYTAIKGSYEKNKFRQKTKNRSIITTFNKVAQRLNEFERETGVDVDNAFFVMALFKKYGKETYPGHLLGKAAIRIYEKKLEELCYTTYIPKKDEDVDRKLLEYLSEVRGETKEQVMAALKDAGIFSAGFIRKWRNRSEGE